MTTSRAGFLFVICVGLAGTIWLLLPERDRGERVRFTLYRPATASFYLDRGASPGDSLDYSHEPEATVPFGAPGDIGLACPQADHAQRDGFRTFAAGTWLLSGGPGSPTSRDLVLGKSGDLPFCADFNSDGIADSGVFRGGDWMITTRRAGDNTDIRFSLGGAGDRPVVLNVKGAGNATDRRDVVYGVYRRGIWYLDTKGAGTVDATHALGGLPQDVPLLIPRWDPARESIPGYSLAIFRDGIWHVKPDPNGAQTTSFVFGQAGDLPGFVYRQRSYAQHTGN